MWAQSVELPVAGQVETTSVVDGTGFLLIAGKFSAQCFLHKRTKRGLFAVAIFGADCFALEANDLSLLLEKELGISFNA